MPLGLMPGMVYEEVETLLVPGECVLFYSDGLVEAHNARREMFGNPRLAEFMGRCSDGCPALIERLLAEMAAFTGRGGQQEDDVTLVTLHRSQESLASLAPGVPAQDGTRWYRLVSFSLPSELGKERTAMERVADSLKGLELPVARLERIKTAVSEGTSNAIEHGNKLQAERPVQVQVLAAEHAVKVCITDQGSGPPTIPPALPDIDAKVAGLQSPRGWGLFLMEKMADQIHRIRGDGSYTVELIFYRTGEHDVEKQPA
jgi:anti-sigma regulatory factor (Ser/Thr protein kinase)